MFQNNLVPAQKESPYLSNSFGNHFLLLTLNDSLAQTAKVFQGQQTSAAATEGPIQAALMNLFVFKPANHIAHVPSEDVSVGH